MGTKLTITEDTSKRVVVTEKSDTSSDLMLTRKKIIFDKLLQRVVKQSGFLFFRRAKEIPFSDIEAVDASKQTKYGGVRYAAIPINYCVLRLVLTSGKKLEIGKALLHAETKAVAERVAEAVRKPLIWLGEEQQRGEPAN